jgi:hypothetical protein
MYLLELSFYEFKQFIQIVLWVSLPLIAVCLAVTTLLHYRRKRKRMRNALEDESIVYDLPAAQVVQPMLSAQNRTTGNEALLKQSELQLKQSREKYQALERSFRMLQENYSAVISRLDDDNGIGKSELPALKDKIRGYELKIAQLEQALTYLRENTDATGMSVAATIENKTEETEKLEKLIAKLSDDLTASNNENSHLRSELDSTANDEHVLYLKEKIIRVEEENRSLKSNVPEMRYLEDMIKEKTLQIDFLQQQLEQRIKHNHYLDHQQIILTDSNESLQQTVQKTQLQVANLEQSIQSKQHESGELQEQLSEVSGKNEQMEHAIQSGQLEITRIINESAALHDKYSGLNELLAEKIARIHVLEEDLAISRQAATAFEEKWENTSQLISRIYRELSGSVDNQMIVSATGAIISAGREEAHAENL